MRPASWLGTQRIELATCASTNDEAARLARAGARHGTVVIARTQTAGRGRHGRTWSSPEGQGVYFSAIVRPSLALADVPPITLAIGIGTCDAVREVGGVAQLKWPNDVLIGGRKVAGVLVESQGSGGRTDAVVVGIGVNLTGPFAPEIAHRATALTDLDAGADLEALRERFVASLCAHVEHWIDRYVASGLLDIIPEWHARMAPNLAVRATVDNRPLWGHVAGLAVDGALLVRDERGDVHPIRSGDVEVSDSYAMPS